MKFNQTGQVVKDRKVASFKQRNKRRNGHVGETRVHTPPSSSLELHRQLLTVTGMNMNLTYRKILTQSICP